MPRRYGWRCATVLGLIWLLGGPSALAAQAKAAAPAAPAAKARGAGKGGVSAELVAELASDKDDRAMAAARRLGELGGSGAADALVAALTVGMRPTVAIDALNALGKLRDPRALPVLAIFAGNVNEPVRLAAVKALGQLSGDASTTILLERLGDGVPAVRAAAAEALGERKEVRAEKRLFLLVARNDPGAAGPLGAVIAPDSVPRLAELHGRIDDGVLATALGEFLKRKQVPDRLRLDVVRTVGKLPGADATAALVEYLAAVPEGEKRPSQEEAQKLLDQRGKK